MQKTLLLATSLALAAGAAIGPALSADLVNAPAPPAPAPASSSGAYSFGLLYTGEAWDVPSGGVRRGASYMNNLDAVFRVDTGKAFGWTGGEFVVEAFGANAMSTGNSYVGAINSPSLIDTGLGVGVVRLYQIYYDQKFVATGTDVRLGIYDLDNEFSITKPMTVFLNANLATNTAFDHAGNQTSGGNSGSATYPNTPLALRVRQPVAPNLSVQVAVADGVADNPNNPYQSTVLFGPGYGALFIGEVDYTPDKYTKLMAGAWELTSRLPDFGQFNADGSQRMIYGQQGAYVGGAMRLYSASGPRGLDGFFTLGAATPRSTDVAESFNTGLVYTGLLDARPGDKIGLAMNVNVASSDFSQMQSLQGNPILANETLFEGTYRARINEYLSIQPDIQYVMHAGYDPTIKNPIVLGIHFELSHTFDW
jgi:porin